MPNLVKEINYKEIQNRGCWFFLIKEYAKTTKTGTIQNGSVILVQQEKPTNKEDKIKIENLLFFIHS